MTLSQSKLGDERWILDVRKFILKMRGLRLERARVEPERPQGGLE